MDTAVEKGLTLSLDQCLKIDKGEDEQCPYASAVGSLLYALLCTRPDICFTVGLGSCYQSNLEPAHW